MRAENNNGVISVRAVAGSYVVLLEINMQQSETAGLLGFGIERTDHKTGETKPLEGLKSFRAMNVPKGQLVSTLEHPVQDFLWSDFTVRNRRDYTYRVVAFKGQPGNLQEYSSVSVTVKTENEVGATHAVYFNRGVAGSQAYARKFENKHPKDVPNREAWRWLSRGLYKAMLDFIGQAKDDTYGLRAAVYEFNQGGVLKAFAKAAEAKADVGIIFDAREVIKRDAAGEIIEKKSKLDPCKANREAVEKAGIKAFCTERTADPNYISHNKFVVLLKDNQPIEVWTGSTNMTDGGIFVHSNVGHIVRDPQVAAQYLAYWNKLKENPKMNRKKDLDKIRYWNQENSPVPKSEPPADSITTIFSPRPTIQALKWYRDLMDKADFVKNVI